VTQNIYTAVLPYKHVVTIQQFYNASPCITSQHKHSSCTTHCNTLNRYTEAVTHIITQNTGAVTHIASQHTSQHTTHIATHIASQHTSRYNTPHTPRHNTQHTSRRNTALQHITHIASQHTSRHNTPYTSRRNTQNSSMTQNIAVVPHIVTHRQATFGLVMLHQATSQYNR